MDLKDLGKFLTGKAAKKRIRKETNQKDPYTRDYSKMDDTDFNRMVKVDEANEKAKKEDRYECGGVKYSKLKNRLKGKKD